MSLVTLDYTDVLADAVGKKNGITEEMLKALSKRGNAIHRNLTGRRKKGGLPFYDLPFDKKETSKIIKAAKNLNEKFSTMVVLGIGGSSLGTLALMNALKPASHNNLSNAKRGGMRLFVADNIDPDAFDELLGGLKLKDTVFTVISKSGSTAETMSQFMIVVDLLKKRLGKEWKKHLVIITDRQAGILRPIAETEKIKSMVVPDGVGGRFTVFTPVSLFPAACAGIDIRALLKGAGEMEKNVTLPGIRKNRAYLFAAIHYLLDTARSKKMTVMMPYSNSLYLTADWFRQMWAESLGKRYDLAGNEIFVGQTPIKALGATDQHSQVQLYVEGPFDKVVVFLDVAKRNKTVPIPTGIYDEHSAISYLGGSSLGELIATEKRGTQYALTSNNRPNMTITLDSVSAQSVGALLYMLEVSTLFAGGLYGIDPLDQPGVEFGKQYAYAMMGREGFEKSKTKYLNAEKRNRKII